MNISEKVHAHAQFRAFIFLQAHPISIAEDFSVEEASVRAVHATVKSSYLGRQGFSTTRCQVNLRHTVVASICPLEGMEYKEG